MKVKLGLDPEILVVNEAGKFVCPGKFLKAPKRLSLSANKKFGGFNRDGMAIELNPTPSTSSAELSNKMKALFAESMNQLRAIGLYPTQQIGANIFENGDKESFMPDVYQGGCDPDWNAYTQQQNQCDVNYEEFGLRFCGGHIHVEAPFIKSFDQACEFIRGLKPLSEYLATFEDKTWSSERRKFYGKEGDFRWREDGKRVEFRTPDATWIWEEMSTGKVMPEIYGIISNHVQRFA